MVLLVKLEDVTVNVLNGFNIIVTKNDVDVCTNVGGVQICI